MKLKYAILIGALLASGTILAEDAIKTYEVTVTNLTKSINITPLLAVSHNRRASLFTLGEPASEGLAAMAEGGDTSTLQATLMDDPGVFATATTGGLLGPGESVTFMIDSDERNRLFSLVGMLLPTNDAFAAISSVKFPRRNTIPVYATAYDAGSEENDELCANIPGPTCGGEPFSDGMAEGYVYISNGINGQGDLDPAEYTWQNPVLKVIFHRISTQ